MSAPLLKKIKTLLTHPQKMLLTGLSGSGKAYFLRSLTVLSKQIVCMVPTDERAYDLLENLQPWSDSYEINRFLSRDFIFNKENFSFNESERLQTLKALTLEKETARIIITTPSALLYPILSPTQLIGNALIIKPNLHINRNDLIKTLLNKRYQRSDTVNHPGEFAVRGGIVDVYPLDLKAPVRIEFFGDVIDSLRSFNPHNQRSTSPMEAVRLIPADEIAYEEQGYHLFDYLLPQAFLFLDEPVLFSEQFKQNLTHHEHYLLEARKNNPLLPALRLNSYEKLQTVSNNFAIIHHHLFSGSSGAEKNFKLYEHVSMQELESFFGHYDLFIDRVKNWRKHNYQVEIFYSGDTFYKNLDIALKQSGIREVIWQKKLLKKGFVSKTLNLAVVSEADLRGKMPTVGTSPEISQASTRLLEQLHPGDYVTHETYGIAIFHGVKQVTTDRVTREYVLLQYAGTDRLYLPIDRLNLLHKYASAEAKAPRLSKLGGRDWERTRNRIKKSIQDMTEELVKLYAQRQQTKGHAYPPDTPWQEEFEKDFPYPETPGQLAAIKDIKADMEKPEPMDRLVCGDVGYGKTEVANRAIFKAVMDNKQVAFLTPTTVLAEQHYQTLKERFANFPVNIEVLSRFRSAAQQKKIVKALKEGKIDIVIATHRLLSKDVAFKALGLLIIDEEHRFGVAQKEKIKALKLSVDILSLSATPIPRSLYMSLSGMRDLSIIDTPPPERYPIATYVMEYDEDIVREAIKREIDRQGQVFFVHNTVRGIHKIKTHLEELYPDLRIVIAHGQMSEKTLSSALLDFIDQKYDVLLSTTIIESGLDMPNVNTIIIDQADRMGLAQLHQLRGRVGRSERLAYAYITYRPDKNLTEDAQKRLNVIHEFNEIGSGMQLALKDLEIRGSGNLLGAEQHGHITAVGFDLYTKMLAEETARLKGTASTYKVEPLLEMPVDLYIPLDYIEDVGTRMRFYRQLLFTDSDTEIEEISRELSDRFGPLPLPVENFLELSKLKVKARDRQIKSLKKQDDRLLVELLNPLSKSPNLPYNRWKLIQPELLEIKLIGKELSLTDIADLLDMI